MAAGSARLLRPLILRDLLVALENAEIHNERLTGQCFLDPKSQKEEAPVPQPALKLQKNCCAATYRMAAGSARLLRPLILRDLLVALENAEIHNERLTGQCFLDPKSQKEEAPVPQPALKLQKNCCAAAEVTEVLAGLPIPVLQTAIRNRTEYAKAIREGKTALETEPSSAAASDISALAHEIQALREKEAHHAAIG